MAIIAAVWLRVGFSIADTPLHCGALSFPAVDAGGGAADGAVFRAVCDEYSTARRSNNRTVDLWYVE